MPEIWQKWQNWDLPIGSYWILLDPAQVLRGAGRNLDAVLTTNLPQLTKFVDPWSQISSNKLLLVVKSAQENGTRSSGLDWPKQRISPGHLHSERSCLFGQCWSAAYWLLLFNHSTRHGKREKKGDEREISANERNVPVLNILFHRQQLKSLTC